MSSKIIAGFYLLIVGICIGGIIVLDIVETTIFNIDLIFRNNDYTSTLITKYDQGIILSDIVGAEIYTCFKNSHKDIGQ